MKSQLSDDREMWVRALDVIYRWGHAASHYAADQAERLLEAKDHEGHKVWLEILDRLEALESTERGRSLH